MSAGTWAIPSTSTPPSRRLRRHRDLRRAGCGVTAGLEHPNRERYGGQRIFVVQREGYAYLVPFVEEDELVVLKTIIPSRKATRKYLGKETAHGEA